MALQKKGSRAPQGSTYEEKKPDAARRDNPPLAQRQPSFVNIAHMKFDRNRGLSTGSNTNERKGRPAPLNLSEEVMEDEEDFPFSPSNLLSTTSISHGLPFSPNVFSPSGFLFSPSGGLARTPHGMGSFQFDANDEQPRLFPGTPSALTPRGNRMELPWLQSADVMAKNEKDNSAALLQNTPKSTGSTSSSSTTTTTNMSQQQYQQQQHQQQVYQQPKRNARGTISISPNNGARKEGEEDIWGAAIAAVLDHGIVWTDPNGEQQQLQYPIGMQKRKLESPLGQNVHNPVASGNAPIKRAKSSPTVMVAQDQTKAAAASVANNSYNNKGQKKLNRKAQSFLVPSLSGRGGSASGGSTPPFLTPQQQQQNGFSAQFDSLNGKGNNSYDFYMKPPNQISPGGGLLNRPAPPQQQQQQQQTVPNKTMKTGPQAKPAGKRWTPQQDVQLRKAVDKYSASNWKAIADHVDGRNHVQCLQRWKKVLQPGLVKGMWAQEEDDTLLKLMKEYGNEKSWTKIAEHIPGRTAKQCRERWYLNLDPTINRGPWTKYEDEVLLSLHSKIGNKWAEIKRSLPGRTENGVKSRFKSIQRAMSKDPRYSLMNNNGRMNP
eukprot:CAMPEP_0203764770 /NCGR_PEP_ID=MMETSP0098-20131031/18033_1 /ASSEMBLY_ACC=CAM_ASM_000208 /TAXON_ID=96639 /ORGANISM=" , Strain NY0313808BC1" /LENGTH=602 /DNA_ID=CAMNT_0050660943 /DNA_START=236 /DNA_END=2044 /DNA_ORIENTATION=-